MMDGHTADPANRPVMTLDDRCGVVLAVTRVLHANGQATERTIDVAGRLGERLGLKAVLVPGWDSILLRVDERDGSQHVRAVTASPASVNMRRVASAMQLADDLCSGRRDPQGVIAAAGEVQKQPADPVAVFASGCALGAASLAVIFGVDHPPDIALAAASGAMGAVTRRTLERYGASSFVQIVTAALIAGLVGAAALRFGLSSSLNLVAICPCMILIPGPHILNGTFDLLAMRMALGAARLLFSVLTLLAISIGLLTGLALGGTSLAETGASRSVPFWFDFFAAGGAAAAYSIFFATPYKMVVWPVVVGMVAHAARWVAMTLLGVEVVFGAMIACLVVGVLMTPFARRMHLPFAAVGFACVVSLLPGIYIFRMASGLTHILEQSAKSSPELVAGTLADAVTALAVVLATSLGLAAAKVSMDRAMLYRRSL